MACIDKAKKLCYTQFVAQSDKILQNEEALIMIYKAIPGPMVLSIKNGDYASATNTYASIINQEAANGWKFHSLEVITTSEAQGCAFNKQVVNTNIYMLIFYKED